MPSGSRTSSPSRRCRLGARPTTRPVCTPRSRGGAGDLEERTWLAFLIAYLGPLDERRSVRVDRAPRGRRGPAASCPSSTGADGAADRVRPFARDCARSRPIAPGPGGPARRPPRSRAMPLGPRAPVRARVRTAGAARPAPRRALRPAGHARPARAVYELHGRNAAARRRQRGHRGRQAGAGDRRLAAARAARRRARRGVRAYRSRRSISAFYNWGRAERATGGCDARDRARRGSAVLCRAALAREFDNSRRNSRRHSPL